MSVLIQSTLVADAYGALVVAFYVGPSLALASSYFYRSVAAYNVVVANAAPAHLAVPEVYLEGT